MKWNFTLKSILFLSLLISFPYVIKSQNTGDEKLKEIQEYSDSWGVKVEAGTQPFFSTGLYLDFTIVIIDLNYAWRGDISGSMDGNFTAPRSSIFRLGTDLKFNVSKNAPRFFLLIGGGAFWQTFKAEVASDMKEYSTFGNEVSKVFTSGYISTGIVYNISKRLDLLGNISYFFAKEETYWFVIPSNYPGVGDVEIGSNITTMNGPGITAGLYFKIGKIN